LLLGVFLVSIANLVPAAATAADRVAAHGGSRDVMLAMDSVARASYRFEQEERR